MILDCYQAARVLAGATREPHYGMPHLWMAAPWMMGEWLGATDARAVALLRPPTGFRAAPIPAERAGVIGRASDPSLYDFIGRATLRALAGWAASGEPAAVGPATFDRAALAPLLGLLAMAGDCDVRVGVSRGLVSEHSGVRSLLLDGEGWRLLLMGCHDDPAGTPGDDTRPPLEPLP